MLCVGRKPRFRQTLAIAVCTPFSDVNESGDLHGRVRRWQIVAHRKICFLSKMFFFTKIQNLGLVIKILGTHNLFRQSFAAARRKTATFCSSPQLSFNPERCRM